MLLGQNVNNQIIGLPFIQGGPRPYPEPIPPELLAQGYPEARPGELMAVTNAEMLAFERDKAEKLLAFEREKWADEIRLRQQEINRRS